jgi:hypothetical protein
MSTSLRDEKFRQLQSVWALAVEAFSAVAVEAKNLKIVFRKPALAEIAVKPVTRHPTTAISELVASAINMIQREKLHFRLAAASAHSAIGGNRLRFYCLPLYSLIRREFVSVFCVVGSPVSAGAFTFFRGLGAAVSLGVIALSTCYALRVKAQCSRAFIKIRQGFYLVAPHTFFASHVVERPPSGVGNFCYTWVSHGKNLLNRFELWLGLLTAQTVGRPFCILT